MSELPRSHTDAIALDQRLLGLSISEVATFLALIDHGGFTTAARALHLSQPGVSARVRRLEAALGVELVDRSIRGLSLTREGAAFEPHARALLACVAAGSTVARQVRRSSRSDPGRPRVGPSSPLQLERTVDTCP